MITLISMMELVVMEIMQLVIIKVTFLATQTTETTMELTIVASLSSITTSMQRTLRAIVNPKKMSKNLLMKNLTIRSPMKELRNMCIRLKWYKTKIIRCSNVINCIIYLDNDNMVLGYTSGNIAIYNLSSTHKVEAQNQFQQHFQEVVSLCKIQNKEMGMQFFSSSALDNIIIIWKFESANKIL